MYACMHVHMYVMYVCVCAYVCGLFIDERIFSEEEE